MPHVLLLGAKTHELVSLMHCAQVPCRWSPILRCCSIIQHVLCCTLCCCSAFLLYCVTLERSCWRLLRSKNQKAVRSLCDTHWRCGRGVCLALLLHAAQCAELACCSPAGESAQHCLGRLKCLTACAITTCSITSQDCAQRTYCWILCRFCTCGAA
jgi:hypothetical protein